MSHPSERLSLLINTLSLNVNSFSTECGYSSSTTIWRIINDNKKPSKPTLDKICARFKNVNKEWLLTGQGSMFFNKESFDDLTVTAKQVLDKLLPLALPIELIHNLEKTMIKVEGFLNKFEQTQKEIEAIHEKITSIEFLEALKLIREKKKEKNGNQLN